MTNELHAERLTEVVRRYCDVGKSSEALPHEVDAKARLMLLDTVGCMLAARSAPEVAAFEAGFSRLDAGSFCFPGGPGLTTLGAAAVGAMAATWDEACEGLALAHGRPGVPVVAALLPQALARDVTVGELIGALVAGYEVGARAGAWLRIPPGMHVDANWPSLGVAAGVARLLALPAGLAMAAINTAACQLPASLYLPVAAGANARNTYLAHSAWLGILATLSAAGGVTAPQDALTHYALNYSAAGDEPLIDPARLLLLEAYFKPHAAVRHAHYGAEAARLLRGGLGGRTENIDAITLSVYAEAQTYCGNRDAQTPIQAQFSLSFGVAAGLRHGGIDAGIYREDQFHDAELRRLERLVRVKIDPALGESGRRGARLDIVTAGEARSARVTTIKGDPAMPMSTAEVAEKFLRYAATSVPAGRARDFAAQLVDCDSTTPFRDIWNRLF